MRSIQEVRLMKRLSLLVLGLATFLAMSSVVRADAVTDWNAIAVQTIVNAGPTHGSAIGFLDNATVQVAVYDAVEAITGRFRPYHVHIPGASSGSPAAAVAKAAHDVSRQAFPSPNRIPGRDLSRVSDRPWSGGDRSRRRRRRAGCGRYHRFASQ